MLEPEESVDRSAASRDEKDPAASSEAEGHSGPDPHTEPGVDESLVEEVAALIDNARNYAEAELAFQKTRAALTGTNAAAAIAFLIVALVFFHIAIIALAVGFVMALAPLVSIWGAIAIVVGALLAGTALLAWNAIARVRRIAAMFEGTQTGERQAGEATP